MHELEAVILSWLIYRTAPKVIPPILLSWPSTSEVDVGDMAVDAEPSHQHSIIFCYCVTDGRKGAV